MREQKYSRAKPRLPGRRGCGKLIFCLVFIRLRRGIKLRILRSFLYPYCNPFPAGEGAKSSIPVVGHIIPSPLTTAWMRELSRARERLPRALGRDSCT